MAEQIRSFWSHLCGIFGAIFGMIAGGTLVTIEKVDAATTTGKAYCGSPSEGNYTRSTLDNGAVVYTCYGGGWVCAKTSRGGGNPWSHDYMFNVAENFPRFYVAFMGCDDGYYSTENFGLSATTSAGGGKILHSVMSSASGAEVVQGYNPYTDTTSTCVYFPGVTFSTSAYYNNDSYQDSFFGEPSSDGYTYSPYTLTDGKCAKCPSYGNYEAMSTVSSSYAKSVSSCFMSVNTPRSDSADQPDGNATGQFIWTSRCNYDAYEASAPECYAMNGTGTCKVTLTQVANGDLMIPIVKDIVGGSQGAAQSIVNSTSLPATIKSNFSCNAARCYQSVASARGAGTLSVSEVGQD